MRLNSSIHPQPVDSRVIILRVSLRMDPRITLMMKQIIVILYYLICQSLLRVLFSHSTILVIRNLSVMLTMRTMNGPISLGIFMQVSLVARIITMKLAISRITQRILKRIKLNIYFECKDILIQMISLGYCAHLTIILLPATFHIASSLAYPMSGQILQRAFPISNSWQSLSAVSIWDTTIIQLIIFLVLYVY